MDRGTLYQLRNLISRSNVTTKPVKDFNSCNDFFNLVVTCHVLVAAMKLFSMKSLADIPSEALVADPQSVWMKTEEERRQILSNLCGKLVDQFVYFKFHSVNEIYA